MNLSRWIIEGIRELCTYPFRSFLSVLGIVMAVASLIAMFALTESIAEETRRALIAIGGLERVTVQPAELPEWQTSLADQSVGLTYADVIALRQVAGITAVSAEVQPRGAVPVRGAGRVIYPRVVGVEKEYFDVRNYRLAQGRLFADLDQKRNHRVAVLGSEVAVQLWGRGTDPVGRKIKLRGRLFEVIGVLAEDEVLGFKNFVVMVPLRTMQRVFNSAWVENGLDEGLRLQLDKIEFRVEKIAHFETILEQARQLLRQTHRGLEDFAFRTREDWFDSVEDAVTAARVSGGFIALISLFVGGLSITNIMLAGIKQRIREIGIRRALGARPGDIFGQVLIEGMLLTCFGAIVGLGAGYGLVDLLEQLDRNQTTLSPPIDGIVFSLTAALLVGVVAALLPAIQAARLSPVRALRFDES